MGTRDLPDNVLYIKLPRKQHQLSNRIKGANDTVNRNNSLDVIFDFSNTEIINSSNISNMLLLKNLLQDNGRQLILCNVSTVTKCIFVVADLDDAFTFAEDIEAALEALSINNNSTNTF